MTDEELRTLVSSLAVSTANNAAEAASNTEAIRELRATTERQAQRAEEQGRTITEGLASLKASSEIQMRSLEFLREGMTYNTETMASALELAAEALKLSANTSRNLDRLEQNIDRLEQMMGIVIRDNQADHTRITRLEEQE